MSDRKNENDSIKQHLAQLNNDIGEQEKASNKDFFQRVLADDLFFRRASGDVVNKKGYLSDLDEVANNPYEISETYVQDIVVDNETAVATVLVIAKRKDMDRVRP